VKNLNPPPKKKLGQNFLKASYYAQRIASSVVSFKNGNILEIGPGLGALSIYLKKRFPRFHLIEMDTDVIPSLKKQLGEGEWTLHVGNVLDFNLHSIDPPLHIVGNLPYNAASHILKKSLLSAPHVASITYMVQREVAERIASGPHSKKIGFISIFCQFFGTPKILFHVPSGAFFPKPKVESSVFQLTVDEHIEDRLPKEQWEDFFTFVSRGFSMRRKMLLTSLSWKTGNKDIYIKAFNIIGIDQNVRPENLDVYQWLSLYSCLEDVNI
jgi:16S rRNA (adenine1518-N6/adenine1519-N6)-dimethyltransferase